MSAEEYLAKPGDAIRLRSGPYADSTATVMSVHPDENYPAENSLVMVKLANGRINSCYMSNLEKLPQPLVFGSSGTGGNFERVWEKAFTEEEEGRSI